MRTILFIALACASGYAQSIVIANSGSTNTAGFQIVVGQSGKAEFTSSPRMRPIGAPAGPRTVEKTIPKALVQSLYSDVEAARPLSSLPPQHCAKSASFGSRLTVQSGNDTSPDLSCGDGGNAKLQALIRDVNAVINSFNGQ
jgi:hypothetical protein